MNQHLVMTLSHYVKGAVISNRMCEWLLRELPPGTELSAKNLPAAKPARTVWLVNSSTLFTTDEHRERSKALLAKAKTVVYVCNDYKLPFPSKWRHAVNPKARIVYLCTVRRWVDDKGGRVLDWNQLTWDHAWSRVESTSKRHGLVYWGACRMDRKPLFKEWLVNFPGEIFTTTEKHRKSFAELGIVASVRRLDLPGDLRSYAGTLLLEDPYSLRNDTCAPNRFYEALNAGLAIVAPPATAEGLSRRGFNMFGVLSPRDLRGCTDPYLRKLARTQRAWAGTDYAEKLRKEFHAACEELNLL